MLTVPIITAIVAVATIGGLGSYLLATSNALSPSESTTSRLLTPYSVGTAPYQYIAYSGSLDHTRQATGIKQYVAAFIISDGSCAPAWGGGAMTNLTSQRSSDIAADFTALRAAGGDVSVSFGGAAGTDLATACQTVPELTQAYQTVIQRYNLTRLDFDIEGPTLLDEAANARRAAAVTQLQKVNPNLKIWVTLPVYTSGLNAQGLAVMSQMTEHAVAISGVNIMAMNYNQKSTEMGKLAITNAEATHTQLQQLYASSSSADIWKAMGITIMVGQNNTVPETFTLADATLVHDFAAKNKVGMISLWNASRDVACPAPASDQPAQEVPSISCSGVDQQPGQFTKILTVPAVK